MVVTGDGAGMTTQPSLYQAVRPRRSQRSQRDQAAVKPGSGCAPRSGSKTSLPTQARVRYLLPRGAGERSAAAPGTGARKPWGKTLAHSVVCWRV